MDAEPKRASLVDLYLRLKQGAGADVGPDIGRADAGANLDALYRQIVLEPARGFADIVEKLRFACYCLDVERDVKEAANLIEEVAASLQLLRFPSFRHPASGT